MAHALTDLDTFGQNLAPQPASGDWIVASF
jgi:hypothetical protein